jgi:hypothetical protein
MAVCTSSSITIQKHSQREVRAVFDGARISSDGGALLLRETDRRYRIIEQAAGCFTDHRRADLIEFPLEDLLRQRVFGLNLGYEDISDHDTLRDDSLLALACGRKDITGQDRRRESDLGKPLAAHATLHRMELAQPTEKDPLQSTPHGDNKITFDFEGGSRFLIDTYLQQHADSIPAQVILDLDATDSTIHGEQEGKWFNAHYDSHCYLPLYIFSDDGYVLWSELQTSDASASRNSLHAVQTIIERIRSHAAWSGVRFIIRGDSGFCRDDLMHWCETNDVGFILGLSTNSRLESEIADALDAAEKIVQKTNEACASYHAFSYKTRQSWSCTRWVTAKAEVLPPCPFHRNAKAKRNPRFVVSHLPGIPAGDDPETLYREWYCPRGEMENRIKEQQLCLFADRVSSSQMWSNQLRQWFSTVAYVLQHALRRTALAGTDMAKAQCSTIRERLLKIGATIRITSRKIWISLSSAHPSEPIFRIACHQLQRRR